MIRQPKFIKKARNIVLLFVLVFSFFITKPLFAQEQGYIIPDSLKNMSYGELVERFEMHTNDKDIAELYAKTYLNKGKLNKDTANLIKAYLQLTQLNEYKEKAIQYADSMIILTKNNAKHEEQLAEAYYQKGKNLYHLGRLNLSLENYIKANKLFLKQKDPIQLIRIKHGIGALNKELHNHNEALRLFRENYEYLKNNAVKDKHKRKYIVTVSAIADTYTRMGNADSAEYYCKKGLDICTEKDNDLYSGLLFSYGIVKYLQQEYDIALDTLYKVEDLIIDNKLWLGDLYLMISDTEGKTNNESAEIYYLKKIDSMNKVNPDTYLQALEANIKLYDFYKNNNEKEMKLYTLDRIFYLDSIYNLHRKNLSKKIVQEYDIPNLIREKDNMLKTNKLSKKKLKIWLYLIFVFAGFSIALTIYFYTRQKVYAQRYNQFVEEQNIVKEKPKVVLTTIGDISKENVEKIIERLNEFELNLGFLDNNITLNSLAKIFRTNTSYLSKVINFYKEKSFSSYINELRIDYFLEVLPHNTIFQNYSIKALAEEFGFNNTETFGKYFYAKTGFYPSFYIKQQKQQNNLIS